MKKLAWGSLFFNLFVIVWGAYVRASGSGAGCGSHWPLCNGEVIPSSDATHTMIEYVHRTTSGICLLLAAAIAWRGVREYPKGSPVRRGALSVLFFTLMEAALGAGLVLLGYTDKDQSTGRVISIALHLFNTFLLLASLVLTAWWSGKSGTYRLTPAPRRDRKLWRVTVSALVLTGLLGITGAVTALGDTLFRAPALGSGLHEELFGASHILQRLRVVHPVLAVVGAGWLFYLAELAGARRGAEGARLGLWLKGAVALQIVVGLTNLLMLAPTPLQLAHLAVAEGVWLSLVLVSATSLGELES